MTERAWCKGSGRYVKQSRRVGVSKGEKVMCPNCTRRVAFRESRIGPGEFYYTYYDHKVPLGRHQR